MTEALRILILEDNPVDAELVQFELEEAGFAFESKVVMTEEDYVFNLRNFSPDLILSDYDLPKYNGGLALAEARRTSPDTPFILVTGAVGEDRAIEILTQGAKDYVLKARLQQRLVPAVKRVLAETGEHKARKKAEDELREAYKTMEQKVKIRTKELGVEMAARKKMQEELRESESRESTHFIELRRKAEESLKLNNVESDPSCTPAEAQKLLHELQVYQIELELLNEELRNSKDETEALMAKYLDIYDFAPIGYFTLNADGIIMRLNLTGSRMLGVERSLLTGQLFRLHILAESYRIYDTFIKKTFDGENTESCEVMILSGKSSSRLVELQARLSEDGKEMNLVMIDILERKLTKKDDPKHLH
jgi:DNA-binding response OmpR family regulator